MIEYKIMTKKRFTLAVETLVVKDNMSYIDAITYIVEDRSMDYNNIKKLLSDSIKAKLEAEASDLNLIESENTGNKLPL